MAASSRSLPVGPPALSAPLAAVTRGPCAESVHRGYLRVVDLEGRVLLAIGDAPHIFPRSALKPLQALPTIAAGAEQRFQLEARHLAVICASHQAEPFHREAVAAILDRIGANEADLHCGPHAVSHKETAEQLIREGREPTPIFSNCSGKHAGMLTLARQLHAPMEGYWLAAHPVQQAIQQTLRLATDRRGGFAAGIDGCGVPTYLLRVDELALAFARLTTPGRLPDAETAAAHRIVEAVNAHPEYIQGTGQFNSVLMAALPGALLVKGGAEGCIGVGLVDRGLGIAVKVADGNARALPLIVLELLDRFDALPEPLPPALAPLRSPKVLNTRGAEVGEYELLF